MSVPHSIRCRATSLQEVLVYCDNYSPGNPPTVVFDRNSAGFNTVLDIYRYRYR